MVSIIIINYNTFQLASNCIASVLQHTKQAAFEIILVDNASTECNPDKFLELFPSVVLVKSNANTGFAGGNNLGIAHSSGDIILLLNSDTYLKEDSISICAAKLTENESTGVVGCKMVYPDESMQYTARKFRTIKWELLDLFRFILYLFPYRKRAALMLGRYFKADFDTACDWLNGAFFMFRKSLLNELPGHQLDNRFFMYGEDHLWCMQIQKLGYQNLFVCNTEIVHINSGSTDEKKRLNLKKVMMKHEMEIMNYSGKAGIGLLLLKSIYQTKENFRYVAKLIVYKVSGRLIK
jgi:GT2 family glycosyltransferase